MRDLRRRGALIDHLQQHVLSEGVLQLVLSQIRTEIAAQLPQQAEDIAAPGGLRLPCLQPGTAFRMAHVRSGRSGIRRFEQLCGPFRSRLHCDPDGAPSVWNQENPNGSSGSGPRRCHLGRTHTANDALFDGAKLKTDFKTNKRGGEAIDLFVRDLGRPLSDRLESVPGKGSLKKNGRD